MTDRDINSECILPRSPVRGRGKRGIGESDARDNGKRAVLGQQVMRTRGCDNANEG